MEKEILHKHLKAGNILAECLHYGEGLIKEGASILEICDKVEDKILEKGGNIAFPAQISINEVAAHACPGPNDKTVAKEGDLLKLDIGVHIDGRMADSAVTVNLGDHDELVKASKDALKAALKVVGTGVRVSEIGKEIHEVIDSYGYAPVRNLSGHGLGHYIVHQPPTIPNYDSGSDFELEEDMVIAIEPFASKGAGIIYESSNPTLFRLQEAKPVRNRVGKQLLKEMEKFNGLPFTTRWLTKNMSEGMFRLGMRELLQKDLLEEYPPLIDKEAGMISQAEHTVIVKDKPIVTTKRQDL